jgi:hypothetical protein
MAAFIENLLRRKLPKQIQINFAKDFSGWELKKFKSVMNFKPIPSNEF